MKEQSQAPDLQERELVPEREYQRVTISGEEKCGVSHSGHCSKKQVFLSRSTDILLCCFSQLNSTSSHIVIFSLLLPSILFILLFFYQGSLHRSVGCCQMCGEGSVH